MKKKKILVEIHHGLGDVIQMTPVLLSLRNEYPDAVIDIIVQSETHKDLLSELNVFDHYYYMYPAKMGYAATLRLFIKLRRNHYDIGFLSPITHCNYGALMLRVIGCKNKVGEQFVNKRAANIFYPTIKPNISMIHRNLNLLRCIGIKPSCERTQINIDAESQKWAMNKINVNHEKIITICIGTNSVDKKINGKIVSVLAKQWPIDRYAELIQILQNTATIVLIGGKKERQEISESNIPCSNKVINLAGETSIKESLAILSISDCIIGGDTGMIHAAAAIGIKTIAIYGPTNPELVGEENAINIEPKTECRYCYGTNQIFECKERACLLSTTVDDILNNI